MNILLATPLYPPEIGGPATYAKLLKDHLPRYGHHIDIVRFSSVKRFPAGIRHVALFIKLLRRGRRADVILAQDVFSVGLPAVFAAKLLRKPFAVRVPGDFAWEQARVQYGISDSLETFQTKQYGLKISLYRRAERFVVRNANIVMTPSNYFSRIVAGWMHGKMPVTVYNGIDVREIASYASEKKPDGIFSIMSAGRMVPWKGFDALIELVAKNKDWTLTLAGEGSEKKALVRLAATLGITERVKFIGSVDQATLWKKIAAHDAFVLNSSFESFSYQVVEAMALGMPVVATTGCNLEEILEHRKHGMLVSPHDSGALEVALLQIKNDAVLRQNLRAGAKERAQEFDVERTVEKLLRLLSPLAGAKRKIIFLGSDRNAFDVQSRTHERLASYGALAKEVVFIIPASRRKSKKIIVGNVTFIPVRAVSKIFYPLAIIWWILRESKKGAILSPQDPGFLGIIALVAGKLTGMRLYSQVHTDIFSKWYGRGIKKKLETALSRFVIRRSQKIRVVSKRIKESIQSLARSPISVIPVY